MKIYFISLLSLFSVVFFVITYKYGFFSFFLFIPSVFSLFISYKLLQNSISAGSTIFHPLPLVSIVLTWSMVFAPLVALATGYYLAIPPKQIEWFYWFTVLIYIYCACLVLLYLGVKVGNKISFSSSLVSVNKNKVIIWGGIFLLITSIAQIYVFYKFGGVYGYILTWSSDRNQFGGLGAMLTIAEAFPIIALFVILLVRDKVNGETFKFVLLLFLLFFLAKILFGGLRGSRSNTIWGLFWFAGVFHLVYYRFKFTQFILGFVFLISFMSIYSIYKTYGVDSFDSDVNITSTGRYEGNPLVGILLTDFSRAGEHAFLVHEYVERDDYKLKFGTTYLTAIFKLIPIFNSPFGSESKNSAGAELFYGANVLDPLDSDSYYNSRIFGLYGEGLLNFGPIFPVFLFFIFGFFLSLINNFSLSFHSKDIRLLLVPFVSNLFLMLVLTDLDNVLFFFIKNGLVSFLFFILVSSYHVGRTNELSR